MAIHRPAVVTMAVLLATMGCVEQDTDPSRGPTDGLGSAAPAPTRSETPTPRPSPTRPAILRATPPAVFYEVAEDDLAGPPGSLIDAFELQAPQGVRAWAVLYRSTGSDGGTVPVSGLVLAPAAEAPGARPVVAWAHGTTGLADSCAPSLAGVTGGDVAALVDLVRTGVVLAATDYEGLGTAGVHPYLVGASEGRSILDSIRAAAALAETDAGARSVVIGISQGGHAALWAGELARAYAPELELAGVVAASPPIDLRALQRAVLADDRREIAWLESLMVAAAWHEVYELPLDGFLTDESLAIVAALTERCPWEVGPPARRPFLVDPAKMPAWQQLLEANSPGRGPSSAPILVIAAREDDLVPPSTIPLGVERLCRAGSRVELRWIDGGHSATVTDPLAVRWITSWTFDRLAGRPVLDGCGEAPATGAS